tara:strand:+ start:457 stop:693 length:237 start_codon:yes stop_codon:yes gene_type:complete
MTDLEKIQDQLEKAMSELKEMNNDETQLAFDYVEYANILVKKLIIGSVSNTVVCSHESYAYTLNNDAKICDDCDEIFE